DRALAGAGAVVDRFHETEPAAGLEPAAVDIAYKDGRHPGEVESAENLDSLARFAAVKPPCFGKRALDLEGLDSVRLSPDGVMRRGQSGHVGIQFDSGTQ